MRFTPQPAPQAFSARSDAPSRHARLCFATAAILTLSSAVIPAILWAGDISWIQDEPRLLAKAFHANQRGSIETHGLNGNFGVPYGPLPTHIYQLLLLITHDPVTIATIRAGLSAAVTAVGLLWLARGLRLSPWFAAAVVLAPYVWNFHRILWDASFAVPIGTIALAAYAAFLRNSSGRALLTSLACTIAIIFIHPQDLPLALPLAGHMLWRARLALSRHYVGLAVILGVFFALNVQYVREVCYAVEWHTRHGSLATEYPGTQKPNRLEAMITPLLGGTLLAAHRFAERDSELRTHPQIVTAAKIGSMLIYPLIWLGIGVVIVRKVLRLGGRNDGETHDPDDPTLRNARRVTFGIALTGLIVQILLYGVMRIPPQPQYFFGTFVLHALFAWVAVDFLTRFHIGLPVTAIYGVSVGYITIASLLQIHREGYGRAFPRPSLANQVQVARELNRYSDETVLTDVLIYKVHPQAIRTLRLLVPQEPEQPVATSGRLVIRYRSGPAGRDSAIVLTELPPDAQPHERLEPIDVTPLPANWHPASW